MQRHPLAHSLNQLELWLRRVNVAMSVYCLMGLQLHPMSPAPLGQLPRPLVPHVQGKFAGVNATVGHHMRHADCLIQRMCAIFSVKVLL